DEPALLTRHVARRPELYAHVQITSARRIHARQTASLQMEDLAALRSSGHAQRERTRNAGHLDVRTKHELRIRHEHFAVEIVTVALEAVVFGNLEHDEHVAARRTTKARVPATAHAHVLPRRNAGRDV